MLYAELDAFEPVAIQEHEGGDGWRVFFRTAAMRDAAAGALASEFRNALLEHVPKNIHDEDWARRSQASLKAIRAGRIIIAPPWEVPGGWRLATGGRPNPNPSKGSASRDESPAASREPPDASREIVIVIEPSMGFGTGHHATTRLCLELLQQIDVRDRRVIDVGTGSGVLALAAWRLGAANVTAIDNDADALQNARENIDRNGATGAIEVRDADLSSVSRQAADIVLANLTAAVLQRHAESLRRLVARPGVLIVSGFSGDELEEIARAFGATPRSVLGEAEWAAASFHDV
jgi:ribosomal protein L11 methyltransferase